MSVGSKHVPHTPGGDDVLAGEYVLGTLDAAQRETVERRIAADPAFAALVADWQAHFSPLDDAYEEVAAPDAVWTGVRDRLFAGPGDRASLWQSVAFWRACAIAAVFALIVTAGVSINMERLLPGSAVELQLAAMLQSQESGVQMLALYDPAHHTLRLRTVSGEAGAGKDFELWLIEPDKAPISMGVVPKSEQASIPVAASLQQKLTTGVVLAISLEPEGGSPTGQATGPVVALGTVTGI